MSVVKVLNDAFKDLEMIFGGDILHYSIPIFGFASKQQ